MGMVNIGKLYSRQVMRNRRAAYNFVETIPKLSLNLHCPTLSGLGIREHVWDFLHLSSVYTDAWRCNTHLQFPVLKPHRQYGTKLDPRLCFRFAGSPVTRHS